MDMAIGVVQQFVTYQTPNKPNFKPQRGEIYFANIVNTKENTVSQKGARPIIIISNEKTNETARFVNYVPLSSNTFKHNIPTHVLVSYESGLKKPSIAIAEQPNLLDKEDLQFRIGKCPDYIMEQIDEAVSGQLGLNTKAESIQEQTKIQIVEIKEEKSEPNEDKKKALIIFKGLMEQIGVINELIYEDNMETERLFIKRKEKINITKNFCLHNNLKYESLIRRVKYYQEMINDLK